MVPERHGETDRRTDDILWHKRALNWDQGCEAGDLIPGCGARYDEDVREDDSNRLHHGRENRCTVCNVSILNGHRCIHVQESFAVVEKPHDAVVKFDAYQNF